MRAENAPDGDMPRGSTNKATGNTLAAHIADIIEGWSNAPLSLNERRALLLTYGMDMTQRDGAHVLGCHQTSFGDWLYVGVGKVVAHLNGDDKHMAELQEEAA